MFFQPDSELASQWQKESLKDLPDAIIAENTEPPNETKMTVFVKMEEPDIFLVEDISDPQTEALVFNTGLFIAIELILMYFYCNYFIFFFTHRITIKTLDGWRSKIYDGQSYQYSRKYLQI